MHSRKKPPAPLAALLGLALAMSVLAAPVGAEPLTVNAVAGISGPQPLFAGARDQVFTVNIRNIGTDTTPSPPRATVNAVAINPGSALFSGLEGTAEGWAVRPFRSTQLLFEGGQLHPGQAQNFTVTADIGRPVTDETRNWSVSVSYDNGQEFVPIGGALSVEITVLNIIGDPAITAPAGAVDKTVTENQNNVKASAVIEYLGAGTLPVILRTAPTGCNASSISIPDIGRTLSTTVRQATVEIPLAFGAFCPQAATQLASPSVVSFGISLFAAGDANTAAEPKNISGVTVQQAANFAYAPLPGALPADVQALLPPEVCAATSALALCDSPSLVPNQVAPGRSYPFKVGVRNLAPVTVTPTKPSTTLKFGTFTATLDKPDPIPSGGSTLEFASATVPVGISGAVPVAVKVVGTDSNGAPVATDVSIPAGVTVTVDTTVPDITLAELKAITPDPQFGAGGAIFTRNGSPITVKGTITDDGKPCGVCRAVARVTQFSDSSALVSLGLPHMDHPIANTGGNYEGSFQQSFDTRTRSIRVEMRGLDSADNTDVVPSVVVEVDNTPPALDPATSFTGASFGSGQPAIDDNNSIKRRTLQVGLNEGVIIAPAPPGYPGVPAVDVSAGDWTVNGHNVVAAHQIAPKTFALLLDTEVGLDEKPTVTYDPCGAVGDNCARRMVDRVGLGLPDSSVVVADKIPPVPPTLNSVDGRAAASDGRFYSNKANPEFAVGSVAQGHTMRVLGIVGGVTVELCRVNNAPGTAAAQCSSSSLGTVDRSIPLTIQVGDGPLSDPKTNLSQTEAELRMDFTAPQVVSFTHDATADTVVVTFDSALETGRNFAIDWGVSDDGLIFDLPSSVTGTGDKRTLRVPTGFVPCAVRYFYDGSDPAERYKDPVTQSLADFTKNSCT